MNNSEMKKMLIKASVFTGVAAVIMLQRAATKHILISDAAGTVTVRETSNNSYKLLIDNNVDKDHENKLTIPLSRSVGSDDIVLEDNYMDHELRIYIDGREEGFYLGNAIKTDLSIIEDAVCESETDSGSVCLSFKLNGLYANKSSLTESNTIEVSFYKPWEIYDRVVVIDPCCGGREYGHKTMVLSEKNVALDVALSMKAISEKDTEHNYKLYFTRLSDVSVDTEKRKALVEETRADALIEIGVNDLEDSTQNGIETTYNDQYFVRGFNNADFANVLEKNCVEKAGAGVIGITSADSEDVLLMDSEIHAGKVMVGNLSGSEDNARLQDTAYKNKLAQGIYNGIIEALEEIK